MGIRNILTGFLRKKKGFRRENLGRCIPKAALLLPAALLFLSACARPSATFEEEAKRERIVIWSYYETDAQTEGLDELVRNFNISQNEYEAVWEYVPMTEFTKRLTMAYTEKTLPDLAIIDNPDMYACIKMGMFEDLTEFLKELSLEEVYYPELLLTVSYGERFYGLPFTCNNLALIYNKELLKAEGLAPPQTWEELRETALALTKEGRSGFLMSCVEGEQGAFQILPWILSAGEQPSEIGGERTKEALSFIAGLIGDGSLTKNCINLSQTDVARVFVSGGAAMMENGPWVLPMLEEAGIDYGVSLLPASRQSSTVLGGENLGLLKGKNQEGAKAFISYYHSGEVMARFCAKTYSLPTRSDIEVPEESLMKVFKEQMQGAMVRSKIPSWNTLSKRLSEALYQLVAGEILPEEAAALLQKEQQ